MFDLLGSGFVLISAVMVSLWIYQRRAKNASHVDVAWAYGIGLLAALYFYLGDYVTWPSRLVLLCSLVWSLRLGTYLFVRVHGSPEDSRYRDLRARWNQTKFFVFYQFQALAVVFFSAPILMSLRAGQNRDLELQDLLAVMIAFVSIIGEVIADLQLSRFKSDLSNRGKTCRSGLWRYSRHPNYFFEFLFWFAFPCFAWGTSYFVWCFLGPIVMLALIFGVSGIPPSEARALKTRGDDYRDYQSKTSVFIPWFPK